MGSLLYIYSADQLSSGRPIVTRRVYPPQQTAEPSVRTTLTGGTQTETTIPTLLEATPGGVATVWAPPLVGCVAARHGISEGPPAQRGASLSVASRHSLACGWGGSRREKSSRARKKQAENRLRYFIGQALLSIQVCADTFSHVLTLALVFDTKARNKQDGEASLRRLYEGGKKRRPRIKILFFKNKKLSCLKSIKVKKLTTKLSVTSKGLSMPKFSPQATGDSIGNV